MPSTPRHGHAPIPMRMVADDDAIEQAGDFCWRRENGDVRGLFLGHPSSSPGGWTLIHIPVRQGRNETGKHWGWDGNEEEPTLTPSLHTIGHWHGWVRKGRLVEA